MIRSDKIHKYQLKNPLLACAISAVSALIGVEVYAQSPKDAQASGLEEIIVTARRREESVQNVPIHISVVDAKFLERMKIEQPEDLENLVPSFMMQGNSKDTFQPSIRGQSINDSLGTTDTPVNIYFGETLVSRAHGINNSMYDVEQVQVLKGVQGTLFGRNSTGGAMIISPAAPTDSFEGKVSASAGNFDHRELQGMVNLPMGDTLALRVAGKMFDRDGFATNLQSGKDVEDKDMEAWRVSLRWNPTEAVESTTIYDHYQHDQSGSNAFTIHAINPASGTLAGVNGLVASAQRLASVFPDVARYTLPADMNTLLAEQRSRSNPRDFRSEIGTSSPDHNFFGDFYSKVENWGVQNVTSVDFGDVTVKNIIGYREMDLDSVNDLTGTAIPLISTSQLSGYEFFSEEFQVLGTALEDKLDWIVGLYYMNEKGFDGGLGTDQFSIFAVDAARFRIYDETGDANFANAEAAKLSSTAVTSGDVENTAKAVYLGLTYRLNEKWTLAGGLRYNEDERGYVATSRTINRFSGVATCQFTSGGVRLPIDQCNPEVSDTFEEITYDATLSYNMSDSSMVYGAFRHGYRSGGFNGRARNDEQLKPYQPELVDEFELGYKSELDLAGMPARTTAALFYQDYQDIQRVVNVAVGGVATNVATVIRNAASGSIQGGELEFEVSPTDSVNLRLFYSYIDGEYDEYIDPASGRDLSNEWLVFAAKHMGGATLSLYQDLGDLGELVWAITGYAQSKEHLDEKDVETDQPGYSLWNTSVTWEGVAGSNFDLRLWGRNLTDEEYLVGTVGLLDSPGTASVLWGAPRTYGLDVVYRF